MNIEYLRNKVVDSFHLQIFYWFIAPHSRRYFQGQPMRESNNGNGVRQDETDI
jgi:hypothetical protein